MNKNRIAFKYRIGAVIMTAALVMGGCTPSGNLISREERKVDYVTPTPMLTESPTPTETPEPTATPVPADALSPAPPAQPILIREEQPAASTYYSTANVNVRKEPSVKGEILGSIVAGTKIDVLEIVGNTWARIDYNGRDG